MISLGSAVISMGLTVLPAGAQPPALTPAPRFSVAPLVGTDIGGAIPVPFSAIGGNFNAYPRLNAALGVRLNTKIDSPWNLGTEITYKVVAMDAMARVANQKFQGENIVQYFTGTSEMNMRFTLLEVPLYVRYAIGASRKHEVLLGGYGAYVFKATFMTYATKGFTGAEPNRVDITIGSEPQVMPFSSLLDSWDAGLIAGYRVQIFPRIHMDLHVIFGLKDIFVPGSDFFDYKMHPMRGSVTVSYELFSF